MYVYTETELKQLEVLAQYFYGCHFGQLDYCEQDDLYCYMMDEHDSHLQ